MTGLCTSEGCNGPDHLRGLCRPHYVAQPRVEMAARAWTAEEERYLVAILDSRPDGLGWAERGELDEIADKIGRTRDATGQRLTTLRKRRREESTAKIVTAIPRRARRPDAL